MKCKGPVYFFIFLMLFAHVKVKSQDKIDIGIFESPIQDTLVIKCRPNYNIPVGYYMTNIQFTIRWPESSNVTQLINIVSSVNSYFQITPQQFAVNGGYRYQVYSMVGAKNVTWLTNQEYPVLEIMVNYPGGCTSFEISNDSYTNFVLNGAYYISIVGSNKTGIRYQPIVDLITQGGAVSPDETICLGSSTSIMTLSGYSGDILSWQKKHDNNNWMSIPGTAGLTEYFATPDSSGSYQYRTVVKRGNCDSAFATPALITVERYSSWNGNSDTLWNNPGNWNACGVPVMSRDVEIPVSISGKYPSIASASQCKSLVIRPGATLKLLLTGSLTVNGTTYQAVMPGIRKDVYQSRNYMNK